MVRSTLFTVIVAALLISTLSYCSAENVYCVTPTVTSCSSCPHNSTNCTTLSEYAQEAELYFTSNTTMVFLPGDHTLDTNITVANVARLTMRGESSSGNGATIVCSGSVGLSFTSMVELKIHSLAFTSCSRKFAITLPTINVALLLQSTQDAELVNCSFHDNHVTALLVNNTDISLSGNTEFKHNNKLCGRIVGGGVTAFGSNLTFTGNTNFLNNGLIGHLGCDSAGAIFASDSTVLFNGTSNFIDNLAYDGAAIFASYNTVLNFNGASNFINNSADGGGAIYASDNTVLNFNGASNFINNSADGDGGAIYARDNTVLSFSGANNFIKNSAYTSGGAICTIGSNVSFSGASNFIKNSADYGGGGAIWSSNVALTFNGTLNFTNNVCTCRLDVNGATVGGGGVFVGLKSTFSILHSTTVYWENNHASLGGAIYVQDASPLSCCTSIAALVPKQECFFQLPGQNLSNGIDVQLVFKNNFADVAGSMLYGGSIDNCKFTPGLGSNNSGEVFNMLVHNNDTDHKTTSTISSNPLRICYCENNLPDCTNSVYIFPRTVYPGETFQVSVVAVGQKDGTVPSRVISTTDPGSNLHASQYLQQANNTCTKLNYTVLSLCLTVNIGLQAEGSLCSNYDISTQQIVEVITHQTCPPGFNLSESAKSCVCEPRLAQYTNNCTITNGVGQITRDSDQRFWVGYDDQSYGVILLPHCPFDYCVNHTVVFPLNDTDMQCAYYRSGLSCGVCKEGYSLMLGRSHCWKCSNSHLVLLIPFAVMGVALVFLLLVCKLTVATGTLSGLIFYANIVEINRTIFLPVESITFLSVFIAWLNLDFGVETCFYEGMDAYSEAWLQFVFPVYILVLVGLMIVVSRFSRRFANMLGNNPVSVLATLILLSYTKILRTLITALYITYLEYPTYSQSVWLYDANVDYLVGKHIPLFIVAVLVFLFLFLPYTLLLLFGQWLQAISHLRLFSWVNRLKPFMDSYHAPYKAKHRYWPGLLLVIRFVLLLVFAFNIQEGPKTTLLAVLIGTGNLFLWLWISGGVYTNRYVNVLEGSFALNLTILTTVTYCVKLFTGNHDQLLVGYTWTISVSIAFATFIGILVYHIFQQLRSTKLWKKVPKPNLQFNRPNTVQAVNEPADNPAVRVADFSRLREPLLEDLPRPNYGAL